MRYPAILNQSVIMALVSLIFSANASADGKVKHVFELFTSQGCYSCPPADALLGEIIVDHDNILALEFHVDYWDTLVYGSAGQWKDPFSSPAYSQRQRDYNRLPLDGRKGVYTPQMVVNGDYAFVGSNARKAKKQIKRDGGWVLDADARLSKSGNLTVTVDGSHNAEADIWLIKFDREHATEVDAGENKGKLMKNYNVVREMRSIGKWNGQPVVLELSGTGLGANQNCAVIVQEYDARRKVIKSPILGAGICSSI